MTELQIGLIGLGAAAVVGVFGFNKWQEMRLRRLAEQAVRQEHADVLLDAAPGEAVATTRASGAVRQEPALAPEMATGEPAGRREPVLNAAPAVDEEAPVLTEVVDAADETPVPPALDRGTAAAPATPIPAPMAPVSVAATADPVRPLTTLASLPCPPLPVDLLDPRIDLIAGLDLVEPVRLATLAGNQREVLQRIARPVLWVGLNEISREWERLKPDSELDLRHVRIGLQLVNRLGPVAETDVALFVGAVQAIADAQMAVVDMPSPRVQEQALALDQFSASVDLEIGINLISKGVPFSGTKIRALAEAAGMVLGANGLFTRHDDEGRAQFSLQNMEATPFAADTLRNLSTHGLTFLLDVPRVAHGERVFLQMIELCRRFADTLQGVMVDDNRAPLGETQIEHIRREFVGKPQAAMTSYGLPAGSPQALRLFS